jgi:tetratricopeptide (TPR) repeat protein
MKLRSIIPLLLLAMQSALPGQDSGTLMRKGENALSCGLWEMAALHFGDSLASNNLDAAKKSQVAIRLAESWIRDGKPAAALDLLGQSFVSKHPEVRFWKGQAWVGLGRFNDAVGILSELLAAPAAPYRSETGFTVASLQLSLGLPEAALETLSALGPTPDAALTTQVRLRQVEILFDLGRTAEAREIMPAAASIGPGERSMATFLEAHLLLAEGRSADAAASFQTLVDQPQGQTLQRHHLAAVGLADALRAKGTPEVAWNFLLAFIHEHPDSPQLEALFKRLENALPETPGPSDPVLERLAQWIPPADVPNTGPLATSASGAAAAWPSVSTSNELITCSLFTRAVGLNRNGSPAALAEARRLLTRLRLENPDHFLAKRALFETARRALKIGAVERAVAILDTLRETATSPAMQGEAAFLEARTAYSQGLADQAVRLFEEAAKSLSDKESQIARLNAAIIRLPGAAGATMVAVGTTAVEDRALAADLELERALSSKNPLAEKSAIEEFLTKHPNHPRVPEARLAAAEASLTGAAPDLSFARAQLDTLAADPDQSAGLSPARIALTQLRLEDLSQDSTAAIATARAIIERHPGEAAAAEATLVLGRNLFQTRNYNDARIVLEKLAASDTDPGRAQAAWLLAARSAALVPTTQSQQEALTLFDKAIASKGSVTSLAMLEKARLMIDMNRLAEASAFLRKWFDSIPGADPLHLPAGLLLGEAIYAQGSVNPNSLTDALAIYDKLLVHAENHPTLFNRLQYLRGRALEQIPDEKDPARKREKQAFIAYYSVVETTDPPREWHYFELCGFRALALLEKAGRWPAAIACAQKIASFKGPRNEEAATRASQLQLKHMIWED